MHDLRTMAESLRTVRHFAMLANADLQAIVAGGRVRQFRAGECIFSEGDSGAGMHVLMEGQVHLTKTGPMGHLNILAIVEPVIMFNEVTVLDGGTNPVSAIAVKDCRIWQIGYKSFQTLLKRYPQLGLGLLRVLAARNRKMIEHYEDLSFRPVAARAGKTAARSERERQIADQPTRPPGPQIGQPHRQRP